MAEGKHAAQTNQTPANQPAPDAQAEDTTGNKYALALEALAEGGQATGRQTTVGSDAAPTSEGPVIEPTPAASPLFPGTDEGDGAEEALAALASSPAMAPATGATQAAVPPAPVSQSQPGFSPGFEEPPRKGAGRVVAVVLLVLLLAVGGAYVAGATYFANHFLPQTTLDGHDVSLLTVDEAVALEESELASYRMHVDGQGLDVTLSPGEAGLAIDTAGEVSAAHDSLDRWQWPLLALQPRLLATPHATSVDDTTLERALEGPLAQVNEGGVVPRDATTAYDEAQQAFVVVPEVLGTTVDEQRVRSAVREGLLAMEPEVALDESCLARPAVLSDDERLNQMVDRANAAIAPISVTVGGTEVDQIPTSTLMRWVQVGDDLTITFDTSDLTTWARGEYSDEHDTIGTTRTYTRPDGRTFTVGGGTYGWCVDGATLAQLMADRMETGSREPIEMPTLQEASVWAKPGERDWGETYIDLDLTEQHMRYYVDGALVLESDVVTGKVSDGHATPTGVYFLNYNKATHQKLIGLDEDHDNKPDYENDVDWWMPFINNMVAFHDAPWRSEFGGQVYYYNGSHGCVNLPPEVAKQLYDLAPVGTVVVVHE